MSNGFQDIHHRASAIRGTAMTRIGRKRPDKPCRPQRLTQRALIFLGTAARGARASRAAVPLFTEPGESLSQCKAGSGRFRVIRVIVVPIKGVGVVETCS